MKGNHQKTYLRQIFVCGYLSYIVRHVNIMLAGTSPSLRIRVGPDLLFITGCLILPDIRLFFTVYPAFSCRITGYQALPDIRPSPTQDMTSISPILTWLVYKQERICPIFCPDMSNREKNILYKRIFAWITLIDSICNNSSEGVCKC